MNTIKIFIMTIALFSLNACNTNLDDVMLADDITALQAMQTSYIAAVESNSSLANYIDLSGITNDQTCFDFDRIFHENDAIFAANHMMYSHNNAGDTHSSGNWSMGSGWMSGWMSGGMMGNGSNAGGGMMGNGFDSSICASNNLDLMDSLMIVHENYHPGN
jgi:hypothetical protein